MTSKAPVRVRGMNAAAAVNDNSTDGSSSGGGGDATIGDRQEPPHRRLPHASMRQLLVAVALLVVGGVLARYTFTEITGGPTGFAGTVEAQNSVSLDFTQTGRVSQILVSAGQTVTKGQPLATLDQAYAQATLQDAQAVLVADRTVVKALESPTLSTAGKQSLQLQTAAAEQQLSAAQQASQDAEAQGGTQIAQAQQTLENAQATLKADTAQYQANCSTQPADFVRISGAVRAADLPGPILTSDPSASASGPPASAGASGAPSPSSAFGPPDPVGVPYLPGPVGTPGPTRASGGSAATQPPQATAPATASTYCLSLQSQLQKDSTAITSAAAALANSRADAEQLQDTAAHSASSAGSALALTQNQEAVDTAPATGAQLSTAQANVASAQTTVDQDQQNLDALTLLSPISGVVADVGGIVGDLDGTDGVHGFSGPGTAQATSGPAFSLFPPDSSSGSSNSGASEQPLIWLVSSERYMLAQVSEDEAAKLRVGGAAKVTVNALGKTVAATITQISPIPVDQDGNVDYPVRLAVPSWPQGTMTGMSADVVFP